MVSKRAEGTTTPSSSISTFREDLCAIARKPEQRERRVARSANLAGRKETEVCGSEQRVGREQLSGDKIQWYIYSLYSDKDGNTTLLPKLQYKYQCNPLFTGSLDFKQFLK